MNWRPVQKAEVPFMPKAAVKQNGYAPQDAMPEQKAEVPFKLKAAVKWRPVQKAEVLLKKANTAALKQIKEDYEKNVLIMQKQFEKK